MVVGRIADYLCSDETEVNTVFVNMIRYLKKYRLISKLITIVYWFIYEYISNHIISHIPSEVIRSIFYRKVLRIDADKTVYFQLGCYVYADRNIFSIGKNTIINRGCVLDRRAGLIIGENVNISPYVEIYSLGHDPNSPTFEGKGGCVKIGDYVWLGTRCMIMPGVTIGEGAFVMPGAVVTKDVAPYEIVGGVPAKKIGNRSDDLQYELTWRMYWG